MIRQQKKHSKPIKVNKKSLEYREGIKEGKRQSRANWIMALDNTKGIGDKLFAKVLEELTKLDNI